MQGNTEGADIICEYLNIFSSIIHTIPRGKIVKIIVIVVILHVADS